MSTIQTFFLLLTPRESFEESIARESADPEAVETLSLNGVSFPPPNTSPLESNLCFFKFLCLEARGDPGGRKLFIFPPAAASAHILIETDAVARLVNRIKQI